jgi:glycosyltransferase involved in cell wall biosynthesis
MEQTKISVVIPVYNEAATIGRVIERVLDCGFDPEVIVVDDASTDGSTKFLREFSHPRVQCFFHAANRGKGAALRLGFAAAKNPYVFLQDADLEYDPKDYAVMIGPLLDGRADMVYGSRFLSGPHRVMFFWHYVANRAVTLLSDMVSDLNLTDVETGMKAFVREKLMTLKLRANRFTFEPEITAKAARAMASLRGAGIVLGTKVRGGQEDRLSRRADGGVRDRVLQIFRLMRPTVI